MSKKPDIFWRGDIGHEGNEPRRDCSDTIGEVIERRLSRRDLLKGAAASTPAMVIGAAAAEKAKAGAASDDLTFEPVVGSSADQIIVPPGYDWAPLAKWGQPLTPGAPDFDPDNITAEAQREQVGYNCDFVAWFDLPFGGIVGNNHEYTNSELIWPNFSSDTMTAEQVRAEIAMHGVSFFEVFPRRTSTGFRWEMVPGSTFNRRIHGDTEIEITGPVAGHPLLQTNSDPTGTVARGTFNNCGGGITPWGTYLTCEENFDQYFANNDAVPNDLMRQMNARLGAPGGENNRRPWFRHESRFDLSMDPNEINTQGWVVEIDPYNPSDTGKKRTAIGRFKHEGAATTLSNDGHAVVYSGDDARFEYLYKFVSDGTYDPRNRAANMDLLDEGTLYVARFDDDGAGEWLPLIFGQNGLTPNNGFNSQAEVLIAARLAADILGATQMDRPEDVEASPVTGKVYMNLTNNTRRSAEQVDAANPRGPNPFGHIIEISEAGADNGATEFRWEIFMLCGDPENPDDGSFFAGFPQDQVSKIANVDNLAFDNEGHMLLATDGQPRTIGINDGIFYCPVDGPTRGWNRQFLSSVVGCECASVVLNNQNNLMLVSIQHPGEGGTRAEPISTFPDGPGTVNRPSLIGVWRNQAPYKMGV